MQTNKPTRNNFFINDMEYIGTYKVVKIYRVSGRREVLRRGLTIDEAKRVVNSYPDRSGSMVVFCKQFSADKYFKPSNKF